MNWLIESGAKTETEVLKNSGTWGNYYNISITEADGSKIKSNNSYQVLKTGITDYTKANNIYDLAGNVVEWTQEANETYSRVVRGGSVYSDCSTDPAIFKGNFEPSNSGSIKRYTPDFNNKNK